MVSPRSFGGVDWRESRDYTYNELIPNRSESLSDAGFCVPTGRHSGRNYGDRRTIVRYGDPQRWSPLSAAWNRALAISLAVPILYSLVVFGYSLLPSWNVSISGTLWHALVLSTVFGFGTIGVPVLLWLRYKIRSPGVLLMERFSSSGTFSSISPFGSGQGDSPGFLFVFVWAPIYLVGYAPPSLAPAVSGFGIATPQCFPRPYIDTEERNTTASRSALLREACAHMSRLLNTTPYKSVRSGLTI